MLMLAIKHKPLIQNDFLCYGKGVLCDDCQESALGPKHHANPCIEAVLGRGSATGRKLLFANTPGPIWPIRNIFARDRSTAEHALDTDRAAG